LTASDLGFFSVIGLQAPPDEPAFDINLRRRRPWLMLSFKQGVKSFTTGLQDEETET
jgi:hypothetical protein